jgi:hypothetical protein
MNKPGYKSWGTSDIPEALWRRVSSKAKIEGRTIKSLFLEWLYEYIKESGKEGEKDD